MEKAALTERSRELKQRIVTEKETRDRWLGVYIGVLALFMAICGMLGNNVTKDANRLNIDASNNWNFFQAKNLRRHMVRLQADNLELELAARPDMPTTVRDLYVRKIADFRTLEKQLTTDPERQEGLDELFKKGKALEAERDLMFKKDPHFDWSQTCLQIAIVLASVCLITGTLWLLYVSAGLGVIGLALLINGHMLFVG